MTRRRAAQLIGLIVAATLMTGCARSAPNPDGWWDAGIHAVDGYWVTGESSCSADDETCSAIVAAATAALLTREPGATITGAVMAGYPTMRGQHANEVTIILAGLQQPHFAILDLADGSRRTIGLDCGPATAPDGTYPVYTCHESEHPRWRVTGS